jgi:hypothetical protein
VFFAWPTKKISNLHIAEIKVSDHARTANFGLIGKHIQLSNPEMPANKRR